MSLSIYFIPNPFKTS